MLENTLPKGAAYDTAAARYILTMRYNPLLKPGLPTVTPSDMRLERPPITSSVIEKMIVDEMSSTFDAIPDAKVAVSLSGGVDSTLVLGLLRRHFPDLNVTTISVRFSDGYDETGVASNIAEQMGVKHTIVNVEDYTATLPDAIRITSQPMWDLHWYHVAKQASVESADILMSGDGGDELFAGYTFRYKPFLDKQCAMDSPDQRANIYMQNHLRDHVPDQEKVFGPRMGFSWDDIWDVLRPHFDNSLKPLEQVFLADYNGKLLYNFNFVSRAMSRHYKMRASSPLLSTNMIRHAMSINVDEKYDVSGGMGKMPLRALLRSMGLEHLVAGPKRGFSPDIVSYWKRYGYDVCEAYLGNAARTISDGWISQGWVSHNLTRNIRNTRYANKLLGLLAFELWYRIFVTQDLDTNFP